MPKPKKSEAFIQIGKSGITPSLIEEIKKQLNKKHKVKIKFLPSSDRKNKKELAQTLIKDTESKIIQQIGFTLVLEEKRKNYKAPKARSR